MKQRGAAVVFAMLIAALAAATATGLLWREQLWLRQFELAASRSQARSLAGAGLRWAILILHEDARSSSIDHLGEPWALRLPPTVLENGEVSGYIADQQALFNLNDLVRNGSASHEGQTRFRRLLQELKLPLELADSLTDWLDADDKARPGGAEDVHYRGLEQPRLTANAPALRIEELLAVRGFGAESWQRLRPLVTALPQSGLPINVNTATGPLLAAASDGLGLDQAQALASRQRRFANVAAFRDTLPAGVIPPAETAMTVQSQFFEISVEARHGEARAIARALVFRPPASAPRVVWQVFE
ncbi:MAG: general secretion pathway protein GspK [Burkholderiales bacterium]|nr:MAG: general secretion pathway protein GspK [Burkholderiales bacterium]CAG1004214.1 Type II secretion system protein K [Myxococcaceae bacterium]